MAFEKNSQYVLTLSKEEYDEICLKVDYCNKKVDRSHLDEFKIENDINVLHAQLTKKSNKSDKKNNTTLTDNSNVSSSSSNENGSETNKDYCEICDLYHNNLEKHQKSRSHKYKLTFNDFINKKIHNL